MLDVGIWNPRVGLEAAGGTETFLRNIAQQLHARNDTKVTIYTTLEGDAPKQLRNIPVVNLPSIRKERRANQLLTKTTPLLDSEIESLSSWFQGKIRRTLDHFNTHDVVSTHYYLDALLLSRSVDVPTVFRLPGIKQRSPRWRALWYYSDCSNYISNSPTTTERVKNWYDRELAGPVYAGVDFEQFKPAAGDSNTVLFVGRIGKGKGVPELVKAAKQIEYPVRIVGDGPFRDELEDKAPDNVTFAGTVPHEEIHREYQNAAVTVLPTAHEAFPVTVIESLACGTPVAATNIDALRLTVKDGKTGVLFDEPEPDQIAQAIREVVDSNHFEAQARTIGRDTVSRYSWAEQADKYRTILQQA